MVHVVFAVRSALKHSVFHGLLRPKFRANFLFRFLSVDVMLREGGLEITFNYDLTIFVVLKSSWPILCSY